MKDQDKTKEQLVNELVEMRQQLAETDRRIAEFETAEVERKQVKETLRESEERFQTLAKALPVGIFRTDAEGDYVYVNERWCEIAGLTPEEAYGDGWARGLHPKDREQVFEEWYRAAKEYLPFELEYRFQRPDGMTTWVFGQAVAEKRASEVVGYVGTITDVTVRRRIEEVRVRSEAKFYSIVEQAGAGIVTIDVEGKLTFVNQAFFQMVGYPTAELLGQPFVQFLHPDDVERIQAQFTEGFRRLSASHLEYRLLHKDGHIVYCYSNPAAILYQGQVVGTSVIIHDITERKQAEETLRQSELRFRELFDHMSNGVAIYETRDDGEDFVIKDLNKAGERISQVKRDEVAGKSVLEIFPGVKEFGLFDVFQRVWKTGESEHHPVSHYQDDRLTHWAENSVYKLPSGEIVAVYDDVTERKRAEEELKRYHDHLEELVEERTAELARAVTEAEQLNEQLEREIAKRKRTEERLECLNRLKEGLLGPGSLDEKLKHITNGIVNIFDVDFARIWITRPGDLCDSDCFHATVTQGPHVCRYRDRCLHLMASSGRYTHIDGKGHRRVPFGCYKIGRVAAGEDPKFVTNDVVHDPRVHDREWAKELGLVSFAGYRLLLATGEPIGVLALFSKHIIPPDEDALLEGLANTTAQVIQTTTAEEGQRKALAAKEEALASALQATRALREAHERLNATLDALPDLLFEVDRHGRIYDFRAPDLELLYVPPQEFLGLTVTEVLPSEAANVIMNAIIQATEKEQYSGAIYSLDTPAGIGWFELSLAAKGDPRAPDARFIALARDVTERKLAEEALQRRNRELALLNRAGRAFSSTLDLDQVLVTILEEVRHLLVVTAVSIWLTDPVTEEVVCRQASGPHRDIVRGWRLKPGEGIVGWVACHKESVIVPDAWTDERYFKGVAQRTGLELRSILSIPLLVRQDVIGVLQAVDTEVGRFDTGDLVLLEPLTASAAIAIENARLYGQARQRALEQEMLREATLALTITLDRDEVIDRILAQLQEVVPYDSASVQLLRPSPEPGKRESRLEIVGGRGFPNIEELPGIVFDPSQENNPNREVVRTRAPFIVEDGPAVYEEFSREPHAAAGIRSWLGVPMLVGDQLIGIITLDKREPGFYTGKHAWLAEAFAAQAAIAVENARLHQKLFDHAEQLEQVVQERTTELQTQYARLDAVLRSTADGIVVADAEGEILQANPVAQVWLAQTLSSKEADRLRETVRSLATRVEQNPVETLELTGLDLELSGAPILELEADAALRSQLVGPGLGEPAVVVAVHDVSHLKALDRMKTHFVANVSHELRTPITTIKAYAHLLRQTPPQGEKWEQHLDTLIREVDRQAQLGEDILWASRIYTGRLEQEPYPTSLNELIEIIIIRHQALAQEQGVVMEHQETSTSRADPGPVALIDPRQIAQVLNMLVEDAIRYTSTGGRVMVSTGTKQAKGTTWAAVAVSDTGEAIPAEDLPHIFERFFREEEPRSMRASETGLRLMIVKGIVELHGGRVTVESKESVGSTFTVWLPCADTET